MRASTPTKQLQQQHASLSRQVRTQQQPRRPNSNLGDLGWLIELVDGDYGHNSLLHCVCALYV
jgi:hypothetical protein